MEKKMRDAIVGNHIEKKIELSGGNKRLDIQGLRAISVLAVVAFHSGLPIYGGFSGVDVFFVISGFVITQMLIDEQEKFGTINLREFYYRRFKRLTPALAIVVSFTLLVGSLLTSPVVQEISLATGISALLMSSNVMIAWKSGGYFDTAAEQNPLLNTWSLSVEEQFYLLFPTLLFLSFVFKKNNGWRRNLPILSLSVVALLSVILLLIGQLISESSGMVSMALGFFSPITRAWEFVAGAMLPIIFRDYTTTKRVSWVFESLGITFVLFGFWGVNSKTPWPGLMTLFPVVGTMLLIFAGYFGDFNRPVSKILRSRLLNYLGNISYSWYLWHWPFIVFAACLFDSNPRTLVLAALFSLGPSILAYRFVENPIRKLPDLTLRVNIVLILSVLLIPVAVGFVSRASFWSADVSMFNEYVKPAHLSNAKGCGQGFVPISSDDKFCTWNAESRGRQIYLIGDSNADHISEALVEAAKITNNPVQIITKGGCSFLGMSWSNVNDREAAKCLKFIDETMKLMSSSPSGLVIIGLSDSIWRDLGKLAVGSNRSSETKDFSISFNYLLNDFVGKINSLKDSGHHVLLILPAPKFMTEDNRLLFDYTQCSSLGIILQNCPIVVTTTLEYQERFQSHARGAIFKAAAFTNSRTLDLLTIICKDGDCLNIKNKEILYKDAGHLTVKYSQSLAGNFEEELNIYNDK
jgi:peptidoglycan/LPS O-acetylase OafA/YrhL